MCPRNALDSVSAEHEVQLQQARQQAVAEYCAKTLGETSGLSDTSILVDLQASNAVSLLLMLLCVLRLLCQLLYCILSKVFVLYLKSRWK